MITETKMISRCTSLQKNWNTRAKKFKDWYEILVLKDELAQEGMESVVSNDPRTGYNLAKHLLVTMIIAHKIDNDELPAEEVEATSQFEIYVGKRWNEQEKRYRKMGRQGWLSEFVGWLLTTGWYSVFSMVTEDKIWAEVMSPATCFPDFGSDGLIEHAQIYGLSAAAANRKCHVMGWPLRQPFRGNTTVYNHWGFDDDGAVANTIIMGSEFVKPPTVDPLMSQLGMLPIFTSPAGGLPDMGSIKTGQEWQKHFGEGIVATNEDLVLQYNKMRTFLQQAARTAAQPHYLELSEGDTNIATETNMAKYGSILRGRPGESVTPLQQNQIPVELTSIMFNYQNELQRGFFPWSVFGNVQQQMSYLAMANVASAAMQTLTPYIDAVKGGLTDIDNFWHDALNIVGLKPHKYSKPKNLPKETQFDVDASVEIPGYLIQRATVARMFNPNFKLPQQWIVDRLFPEIKDPIRANAQVRSEEAMMHPKAIIVDQIIAYREQARVLREANNVNTAKLYEKLAKSLEAELDIQQQPPPQQPTGAPPEVIPPAEVAPRELAEPTEGAGRTV